MASSTAAANQVMERSNQDSLKCPRCDSSNTKFCYYNNYSLSQPRHFCKACKRYWTRGGTLRNVPVGGGCRKNKKVKRQPSNGGDGISSSSAAAVATSTATIKSSTAQPEIDPSPTSNRINNPLLFSLPTNHLELNFPFSRFNTNRVSSDSTGFRHQVQINDTNPMFFGSSTSFSAAPTSAMASLLASSIQHQRFSTADVQTSNDFSGLMPYEDMQMLVGNGGIGKESNIVEGENRLEWNSNQIEQINSSDSSSLLWNTNNVGALLDPSNMGSSVLL